MKILPLQKLRHDEGFIYGESHAHLANLHHHGFPIAKGYIFLPPTEAIEGLLKKHHIETATDIEHRQQNFKKDFFEIPPHDELAELDEDDLDKNRVWQDLLTKWLYQVTSKITRNDLDRFKRISLSPQSIFILNDVSATGLAYFDPNLKRVIVYIDEGGSLEIEQIHAIDTLVVQANKKLLLPYVYHWVLEKNSVLLIKLVPFTDKLTAHQQEVASFNQLKTIVTQRNGLKLYQDVSRTLTLAETADGFLIDSNKLLREEESYFKINEVASSFQQFPVLVKFSEINFSDFQQLRREANIFSSLKNLKHLLNLQLVIPTVHSETELHIIKRELSVLGITRKGSLKIWLEVSTAENLLAIESYISGGIDGVLIQIDKLYKLLNGYSLADETNTLDPNKLKTVLTFLESSVKLLQREKIPVLIEGEIAKNDEVINFAVKNGLLGLISALTINENLSEHIQFVEKNHFALLN